MIENDERLLRKKEEMGIYEERQKPQPRSEWSNDPSPSHSEECTKLFWEWKECHKNNSFFQRNFMGENFSVPEAMERISRFIHLSVCRLVVRLVRVINFAVYETSIPHH